jgi:hypothetical protein
MSSVGFQIPPPPKNLFVSPSPPPPRKLSFRFHHQPFTGDEIGEIQKRFSIHAPAPPWRASLLATSESLVLAGDATRAAVALAHSVGAHHLLLLAVISLVFLAADV